jgi:parallel beta-helix repeat protein
MLQFVKPLVVCLICPQLVWAASYCVDPASGSAANPGTMERPWRTLEEVFSQDKKFEAGDVVYLRGGHHGAITVRGLNDDYVTITSLEGHNPIASSVRFNNARFWRVKSLTITPEFSKPYTQKTLVDIADTASNISIEGCRLYSVKDTTNWSARDWVTKSCFGVIIRAPHCRLLNNHLLNVDHGITILGNHNVVENNTVENFSGDGIRALADHCIYRHNIIKNCFDVDDNHDDGIQSWSVGENGVGTGVVKDVVIDGNLIINHCDPAQKFKGTLQGIGCFDGFYSDWLITNNIVIVDHWHGITLGGATNCRIINNTVVDTNDQEPGPPWILIGNHKDGRQSSNNVIRNNLAKKFPTRPGLARMDHNMVITDYDDFFADYRKRDPRLRPGSPACDAGSNEGITAEDFLRNRRLRGGAVDAGAIEYQPADE